MTAGVLQTDSLCLSRRQGCIATSHEHGRPYVSVEPFLLCQAPNPDHSVLARCDYLHAVGCDADVGDGTVVGTLEPRQQPAVGNLDTMSRLDRGR